MTTLTASYDPGIMVFGKISPPSRRNSCFVFIVSIFQASCTPDYKLKHLITSTVVNTNLSCLMMICETLPGNAGSFMVEISFYCVTRHTSLSPRITIIFYDAQPSLANPTSCHSGICTQEIIFTYACSRSSVVSDPPHPPR
jgi:hypothetical protein